jgi:Tat protein translocase TatB subunit
VVLLILESLGSTELVFILIMALVFFGPRKLPQLSRTLGKNIATFRRASDDFKRTWDREVSLEELNFTNIEPDRGPAFADNSILDNAQVGQPIQPPTIEPVPADRVIARGSGDTSSEPTASEPIETYDDSAPLSKREWL